MLRYVRHKERKENVYSTDQNEQHFTDAFVKHEQIQLRPDAMELTERYEQAVATLRRRGLDQQHPKRPVPIN